MKIDSSAVAMNSTHTFISASQTVITSTRTQKELTDDSDSSNTSSAKKDSGKVITSSPKKPLKPASSKRELQLRTLKQLLKMLRTIRRGSFHMLFEDDLLGDDETQLDLRTDTSQNTEQVWVRNDSISNSYYEAEATTFSTTGIAKTEDGRELSFNINLSMSREFVSQTNMALTSVEKIYCDPLVINLDSSYATMDDQTFLFDINGDGKNENLNMLSSGSGFLALDKNGDGTINDGSELFGTSSGNGFADLSAYDSDGNGWIDENDDVYSKLNVWIKSSSGVDMMLSLKDADVGAIYLGNVSTTYSLNNQYTNDSYGRIMSSGIFLHESSGQAGSVNHVDFSI